MAINLFSTADDIQGRLNAQWRGKDFDPQLVGQYCAEVEVEHICDVSVMWKFYKVPLEVGPSKMVLTPCNIYKIVELMDQYDERLIYNKTRTHLTNIRNAERDEDQYPDVGDTLYITYIGVPVDEETGMILIPSGHEIACETWNKIKFFEEDYANGNINGRLYETWLNTFPGQVDAIRGSFKEWDDTDLQYLNIIQGNILNMIGDMPLSHQQFEQRNQGHINYDS